MSASRRWILPLLVAGLLALAGRAGADERITRYHADISVAADASIEVTETIAVRAEGSRIRRGIYRDFPTRYRDRFGNRVVVDFEVLGVERDGRPEPWFTESLGNGVRINTGNDDFLPVPAEYVFTLRYRSSRQLGFFDQHDELYWNVTGNGWIFPIDRASASVRLPQALDAAALDVEAYTGPQGAQGRDYRSRIDDGVVHFETTRPLGANEGLTLVVGFPKGIVTAPDPGDRIGWFVRDNVGPAIALAGLVGVLVFYLRRWQRLGRDPQPGVIFPQYRPPDDLSPALLRQVWKMGYDAPCFSADIVDLGVRGLLRIERSDRLFAKSWSLHRTATAIPDGLPDGQRALLTTLFAAGPMLELQQRNHVVIGGARTVHMKALQRAAEPRYYVGNLGTVGIGAIASVGTTLLAFRLTESDTGLLINIGVAVLLVVINLLFIHLMRQPTAEGRALLDRIEGLRQYLGVAERDELRALRGPGEPEPELDAGRYEALLPHALALDVEKAWTQRFTAAVGAAAAAQAAQNIGWYSGGAVRNLGEVSSALGSGFSSAISSSARAPGSSSGGGGGGSSGGGGGGGGGGGR